MCVIACAERASACVRLLVCLRIFVYACPTGGGAYACRSLGKGDRLLEIDGEKVKANDLPQLTRMMMGHPGSSAVLSILRKNGSVDKVSSSHVHKHAYVLARTSVREQANQIAFQAREGERVRSHQQEQLAGNDQRRFRLSCCAVCSQPVPFKWSGQQARTSTRTRTCAGIRRA